MLVAAINDEIELEKKLLVLSGAAWPGLAGARDIMHHAHHGDRRHTSGPPLELHLIPNITLLLAALQPSQSG